MKHRVKGLVERATG